MTDVGAPVCAWSNRPDEGTREILLPARDSFARPVAWLTCPRHESQVRAFHERRERDRTRFLSAFVAVLVIAPFAVFVEETIGLAIILAVAGSFVVIMPYATPQTVRRNGIAQSVLLVRGLGGVLLFFAAVFLLSALL